MPTASVLIAVHNERPELLDRAIDSILGQTFEDFEVILVDDGSDDPKTREALHHWSEVDPRVRLFTEPHRGLTRTLNVGLASCRGAFVFRHDSDDWSDPTRFAKQIAFMSENPAVVLVGSYYQAYQETGSPLWVCEFPTGAAEIKTAFPVNNPFCHGAVCFRRAEVEQIGGYREALPCSQDYDLFWRIADRYSCANIPEVLYHRITSANSITTRLFNLKANTKAAIQRMATSRRQGQELSYEQALSESARSAPVGWAEAYRGDNMMLAGRARQALQAYWQAIGANPFVLSFYLRLPRLFLFQYGPSLRRHLFSAAPGVWRLQAPRPPYMPEAVPRSECVRPAPTVSNKSESRFARAR